MAYKGSKQFPYEADSPRLRAYETNAKLLNADHYGAFSIKGEKLFTEKYNRLRYVVVNFAGLVSKVSADMLFGEGVGLYGDKNQDFIEGLDYENALQVQLLEQAMSNSALGDGVWKIYVKDDEVKIVDTDPAIWFPTYNKGNPREKPEEQELAWVERHYENGKELKFLIREVHTKGKVTINIHALENKEPAKIGAEWDVNDYNTKWGTSYVPESETNIDKLTIVHVPNMRLIGSRQYTGTSDYNDFQELLFELENRMTKVANVLDKHTDPILAVPDGVLDEDGKIKKEAFNMFEMGDDGEVPQYIVWNASLENAFKQIDKLVEFMYMTSETSPDVLGMGKGQAESGRALKMRLLRTIAKTKRKQRYYEQAIREVFEVAQLLSMKNGGVGITYNDKKLTVKDVESINIKWSDGIVNDIIEELEVIDKRLANETMTREQAIMELDDVDEKMAEDTVKQIDDKKAQFNPFFEPDSTDDTNDDNADTKINNGK